MIPEPTFHIEFLDHDTRFMRMSPNKAMERQSNKLADCRLFIVQVGVAMQGGAVWWDPVRHLHANMAATAPSLLAAPGAPVSLAFKVNEGRKDNW